MCLKTLDSSGTIVERLPTIPDRAGGLGALTWDATGLLAYLPELQGLQAQLGERRSSWPRQSPSTICPRVAGELKNDELDT